MKKVEDITIEEIIEAFTRCKSNNEVMQYFGRKNNGAGHRFIQKIREKANIDYHSYFPINSRESYETTPKRCEFCGKIIPYEKRKNKFCSSSCSTSYNNIKRGKHKIETRVKISKKISGEDNDIITKEDIEKYKNNIKHCLLCGKEIYRGKYCSSECKNKYMIKQWENGVNFVKGSTQVPSFIRKYLFDEYNCKCQLCGWGEKNKVTDNVPLEIHHIDGDCTNNKKENLQLLCPNCHSLTETFGSLNKESKRFHRKKITKGDNTASNM